MDSKSLLILIIFSLILIQGTYSQAERVSSFEELAESHCRKFPIQVLYRLSSGTLAEKYGSKYAQIDCYVLQFVNEDGQNKQENQSEQDEEQQENHQAEDQQSDTQNDYVYPEIDPIVQEYAKGIKNCLPQNVDSVQATNKIWRFYRYLFQHDYALQWMRAKIRSTLGYQAQRPNAWMDGQQNQKRLRLDKLFSNQFYEYVDKLMFRDFLFPLLTFLKKNVVVGLQGSLTSSGKPIILQFIESKNIVEEFFQPVLFSNDETNGQIFTYTLPGVPLFLGGSSVDFMWAFTGVLVDRSNIEQIQTVGNKFYHYGIEEWIYLENITKPLAVKDSQPYICKYMHSSYGTLFEKHEGSGKVSEYITRWHQDEQKVRNLFSQVFNLIKNKGVSQREIEFPFNSMLIANQSGLFHYICDQHHPSYFLYPDLASEPDHLSDRWISKPKRGIFIIANTHLTTINQKSYVNKQILSPLQEQITIDLRKLTKTKVDTKRLWDSVLSISTDPLIKKRLETLIFIYRKSKFVFLPEESIRKQCDQLISILEKWDFNLQSELHSPVFILWDYFLRQYTFNHFSSSKLGTHIARHRVTTDSYWTSQPELWKKVVSYGECDSDEWYSEGWNVRLNNTGLNCTCFFNVIRGLNRTREILRNDDGTINQNIALSPFDVKKVIDISEKYLGTDVQEAFNNFYSKNLGFVAELQNPRVVYLRTYKQVQEEVVLSQQQVKSEVQEDEGEVIMEEL